MRCSWRMVCPSATSTSITADKLGTLSSDTSVILSTRALMVGSLHITFTHELGEVAALGRGQQGVALGALCRDRGRLEMQTAQEVVERLGGVMHEMRRGMTIGPTGG